MDSDLLVGWRAVNRYDFNCETQQDMEKYVNKALEETDKENELKPRLPIRRNQDRHEEKLERFPRITGKSSIETKGI